MKTQFKMQAGKSIVYPNAPVIIAKPGYGYIWVGNDHPDDMACFATLKGRKTLLALAAAIRKCAMGKTAKL